jgi:hypothetical protein
MEKTMYALTYCFEGTDQNAPYGTTIAVSYDIEKLREEMMRCVEEDCSPSGDGDEFDGCDDSRNFEAYSKCDMMVKLTHKFIPFLHAIYRITEVDVL